MKISALRALCEDAVARFKAGEMYADYPFLYLSIPRPTVPRGRGIRLCGRHGPVGDFLNCKFENGMYNCLATFNAQAILDFIKDQPDA